MPFTKRQENGRASEGNSPSTILFPKCLCWSLLSLPSGLSPHYTSLTSNWARKTLAKTKSFFWMYFKTLSSVLEDLHLCQYGAELQGSTASVPWNWFVGTKSPLSVLFSPSSTADMHVSQLHSYNSSFLSYCHTVSGWHQLSVTLLPLETKEISASLTLRTNCHLCLSYCHIPRTYWATQSPACLDSSEENDWSKLFGPQSGSTLISCGAQSCPMWGRSGGHSLRHNSEMSGSWPSEWPCWVKPISPLKKIITEVDTSKLTFPTLHFSAKLKQNSLMITSHCISSALRAQ